MGFGFVLAHDGELDAVEGEQFFQGEPQGLGDEDVDFKQGLAAGVVGSEGAVALPVGSEPLEELLRYGVGAGALTVGGDRPVLLAEIVLPGLLPEFGVVAGNAYQRQPTSSHLRCFNQGQQTK